MRLIPELLIVDARRDDNERDVSPFELVNDLFHVLQELVERQVLVVRRRSALSAGVVRAKEDVGEFDLLCVWHLVVLRLQNRPGK